MITIAVAWGFIYPPRKLSSNRSRKGANMLYISSCPLVGDLIYYVERSSITQHSFGH